MVSMTKTDFLAIKDYVTKLEESAFQHGRAQNMDMKNREYYQGLRDAAHSEFLDMLIDMASDSA